MEDVFRKLDLVQGNQYICESRRKGGWGQTGETLTIAWRIEEACCNKHMLWVEVEKDQDIQYKNREGKVSELL